MPRRLAALLVMLCPLWACQAPPERPPASVEAGVPWATYQDIEPEQGRVYRLLAEESEVRIYVYRAGPLAAHGHNHVISTTAIEGAVLIPADGTGAARFDLAIPVTALVVDDTALRNDLGAAFAGEVDDEARAGTRANMLGPRVLDAARFSSIGVSSRAVHGEPPKLVVDAAITLHGATRQQWVPVHVALEGDRLHVRGALAIRQSDFGIEPFSALGGLLRVADAVMIEFDLTGVAR